MDIILGTALPIRACGPDIPPVIRPATSELIRMSPRIKQGLAILRNIRFLGGLTKHCRSNRHRRVVVLINQQCPFEFIAPTGSKITAANSLVVKVVIDDNHNDARDNYCSYPK